MGRVARRREGREDRGLWRMRHGMRVRGHIMLRIVTIDWVGAVQCAYEHSVVYYWAGAVQCAYVHCVVYYWAGDVQCAYVHCVVYY